MACNKYSIFDLQKGKEHWIKELKRKNHSQVQKAIVLTSKRKQFSKSDGEVCTHPISLTHTHTQIHPWHWIVMSDTKSTVLRCYISPHNTGVNWQYKPLNKACMLLTHTYTELSGLGFLSNCIHRTHTHTHWVIAELLDLSDELDVKIRCSTSWRLVNYITEMCLGNISKTMTEGDEETHTCALTVQLPWLI